MHIILGLLSCLTACLATEIVNISSAAEHSDFIHSDGAAVVLYSVTWCHWSRKFAPIFTDAAAAISAGFATVSRSQPPKFGSVRLDKPEVSSLLDSERIFSFPTVKFHMQNRTYEYKGEHRFKNIVSWVLDKLTAKLIVDDLNQFQGLLRLRSADLAVVLVNPTPQATETFNTISLEENDDHIIYATTSSAAISKYLLGKMMEPGYSEDISTAKYYSENPELPYFALINNNTSQQSLSEFTGHLFPRNKADLLDATKLRDFIHTYQFPLISRFTIPIADKLFQTKRPFLVMFMQEDIDSPDARLPFIGPAVEFRKNLVTIMSGETQYEEKRLLSFLGVETVPALIYARQKEQNHIDKYFAPKKILDLIQQKSNATYIGELISAWLKDAIDERLPAYVKSEPVPSENSNPGPLKTVVGLSFDEEVINSAKDVFVDFFAPWCGHCRVLSPVLENVAAAFKESKITHIQFAKMDAVANEFSGYDLSNNHTLRSELIRLAAGYPTLLFYVNGHKQAPYLHSGSSRDGSDIVEFIAKHTSKKFSASNVLNILNKPRELVELPRLAEEL